MSICCDSWFPVLIRVTGLWLVLLLVNRPTLPETFIFLFKVLFNFLFKVYLHPIFCLKIRQIVTFQQRWLHLRMMLHIRFCVPLRLTAFWKKLKNMLNWKDKLSVWVSAKAFHSKVNLFEFSTFVPCRLIINNRKSYSIN